MVALLRRLTRRGLPAWWWAVTAGCVASSIVAVIVAVALRPAPDGAVRVPDLAGRSVTEAAEAVAAAGLAPAVRYRHDPPTAGALSQSLPPGAAVAPGTTVEIVVSVALGAPTALSPETGAVVPGLPDDAAVPGASVASVELAWTQSEPYVTSWRVVIIHLVCALGGPNDLTTRSKVVTEPRFSTVTYYLRTDPDIASCPSEYWWVAAMDDFGNLGPIRHGTYRLYQPGAPPLNP